MRVAVRAPLQNSSSLVVDGVSRRILKVEPSQYVPGILVVTVE